MPDYELLASLFPNVGAWAFILFDLQTLYLKYSALSSSGFQLIWSKVSLPHTSKYIFIIIHSPNSNTMDFYSIIFPNQLKLSLFNLHALKLLSSSVISMSTTKTGSSFLQISPTLLVMVQRPFPLLMTWHSLSKLTGTHSAQYIHHTLCLGFSNDHSSLATCSTTQYF